jgi:transposase-like protein
MDILSVFRNFKTQEQCIDFLEQVRWRGDPACVYCGSLSVCQHASGDRKMPRWQCQDCSRAFAVTVGTIFHGTHMPLQTWFMLLALMLNAKKSASACQIARDLGVRRPTVWSMMHRVRVAMAEDQNQSRLLHGIVEADEAYVGGRPRKRNRREDDGKGRPGRGTEKTAVLGAIERGGRVVAEPAPNAHGRTIAEFLERTVQKAGTLLVTDEWGGYKPVGRRFHQWAAINHKVEYANGMVHTNTIEGFWSLLKRAWYGSHHHYSKGYMPLYVSEACYKYNHRRDSDGFRKLVGLMVGA